MCVLHSNRTPPISLKYIWLSVSIVSRVSSVLADAVVVGVTWRKTFRQYKEALHLGIDASISGILFRDGKWQLREIARSVLIYLQEVFISCKSGCHSRSIVLPVLMINLFDSVLVFVSLFQLIKAAMVRL